MDDHSSREVTDILGAQARDAQDEISLYPIVPLWHLVYELYGQAEEVGERFCREVTRLSRGCVRLLLWDQWAERDALAVSPAVRLKLPVTFRDIAYGEMFIACDPEQPTRPALMLETSSALAETCGEMLHVLEEGALLGCLGQQVDLTLAARLSRRQLDVLRHMAMGEDDQAIARALRITTATVKTHRSAIYARLGVHGPVAAILVGHRLGLISLIGSSLPPRQPSRG